MKGIRMHFQLSIDIGNEAMQTAQDIGLALSDLGARLQSFDDDNWTGTAGLVKDINGNKVGTWEVIA